jgi:hypothetical protein
VIGPGQEERVIYESAMPGTPGRGVQQRGREQTSDPGRLLEGSTVWKGFQRRWALGLQMYRYAAGQPAK